MSYEIPQQLEYKEKIMFGLTFKQLAYAFLFGGLGLIIFFKTNLNLAAKITIVAILVALAAAFMFFELAAFLKNFRKWLKFRKANKGSAKLEKFIAVQDVQEDEIHV